MNILLYVNSYLPSIGGRELVVHYLAQALQELGHNVRIAGPSGWWKFRKLKFSYRLHRWPTLRGYFPDFVNLTQLYLDTALWRTDVIHAHSTYPSGYAAVRVKAKKSIPVVITPHGEDIHVIPSMGFGQRLDPIQEPKIRHAIDNADLLTAISESVESSLLDAGTPKEKIRAVSNGVDMARFQRSIEKSRVLEWLKFPELSRVIVTVGNFHPRKGLDVLIKAMRTVISSEPQARLVVVGRGVEVLQPLVSECQLEKHVILVGPIDAPPLVAASSTTNQPETDWLAAILQTSEVYVSAGVGEGAEGLSLALLEAMAAKLPIVATNISGNRDVIEHGVNGMLVRPSDPEAMAKSIVEMFSDRESRENMSINALEWVQQYDWKKIAQNYVDVYQEARERVKGQSNS